MISWINNKNDHESLEIIESIKNMIAKKCPEVNVVIAGGTVEEAKRKFGFSSLPKNMLFVGSGFSDNINMIMLV